MTSARVRVALPVPLHRLFDYRVEDLPLPPVGVRVQVPFGPRSLIGFVVEHVAADAPPSPGVLKPVAAQLDDTPLLPDSVFALCRWLTAYYHQPPGEVLALAIPTALRRGAPASLPAEPHWQLTEQGRIAIGQLSARARRQRAILEALSAVPLDLPALRALGADRSVLAALEERGLIAGAEPVAAHGDVGAAPTLPADTASHLWTDEQHAAIDALTRDGNRYGVSLLDGVTGAGKTEVYLAVARQAVSQGRQVLLLVPEIGLTPQLLAQVRARLGPRVAAYHSGLGDAARLRIWRQFGQGSLVAVVGTRSAVFLPMRSPGLIVVDEEHDTSLKQQDGVPYSARDAAIVRGREEDIPVVLGSATPSLETLLNARSGRYRHLRLTRRAGGARPPRQALVDVRGKRLEHGLSAPLLAAIDRHLAADGQVMLFINRRGFAPALLCHDCGWAAACPNCDARPTLHRRRRTLTCHHCGTDSPLPVVCPQCESARLIPVGQGTERIEAALAERYPTVRCERFDTDRLQSSAALEHLLEQTRSGDVRLLVGTQLLAKGHDFAGLTLVGVVSADQALFSSDFRALERMGQLLTQVAGRAGRGERPGEVLLQTHEPDHPLLHTLLRDGYHALADALLEERQAHGLPPYAALAMLRADALDPGAALAFLGDVSQLLPAIDGVDVLGPAPAPMERRAGRHRAQLLLRANRRGLLQQALAGWPERIETHPAARRVRWTLDVDPADVY